MVFVPYKYLANHPNIDKLVMLNILIVWAKNPEVRVLGCCIFPMESY